MRGQWQRGLHPKKGRGQGGLDWRHEKGVMVAGRCISEQNPGMNLMAEGQEKATEQGLLR